MVSTEELTDMCDKVQKLLDHTDGKTQVVGDDNITMVKWNSIDKSCLKFIVDFNNKNISLNVSKNGLIDPIELELNTDTFSMNNDLVKPLDLYLRHILYSVSEDDFKRIEIQYLKVISEVTLQSQVKYLSGILDAIVASSKSNINKEAQRNLYDTLINNIKRQQYGAYLKNIKITDINMGQKLFDKLSHQLVDFQKNAINRLKVPRAICKATVNYAKRNKLKFYSVLESYGGY